MDTSKLTKRIEQEFGATHPEARNVTEKASRLEEYAHANPDRWNGPSTIDSDYILSRLDMAPKHLTVTGKWNWWAGSLKFIGNPDFKID